MIRSIRKHQLPEYGHLLQLANSRFESLTVAIYWPFICYEASTR